LVVIARSSEDEWLWLQARSIAAADWWVGLSDQAIERTFIWVDGRVAWTSGEPQAYVNWALGEPEDDPDQDCVELRQDTGQWADATCGQLQRYICEL
jgi:hypothetical protein